MEGFMGLGFVTSVSLLACASVLNPKPLLNPKP